MRKHLHKVRVLRRERARLRRRRRSPVQAGCGRLSALLQDCVKDRRSASQAGARAYGGHSGWQQRGLACGRHRAGGYGEPC